MNGDVFAPAMLFASLGLVLAFSASRRALAVDLAFMTAFAAAAIPLAHGFANRVPTAVGCWIGVLAAAACLYLPRPIGARIARPLCASGGLWAGATIAGTGEPIGLAMSLPWVLLCVPGTWLVERGHGVVVKVVGSWLAAAAVLSLGLHSVPTLGFEPDHRE